VQAARDRRADAPRGAGDESGFPLQIGVHVRAGF
jgi:hypothetical protein